MNIVKVALIAATLAAPAFAASAAPSHLTDVQYIAANRCLALMDSKALGPVNDTAMKALIKEQMHGRDAMVWDMGDKANEDAASEAGRASAYTKGQLLAERDGACAALLPPTQTTAAPSTSHND
jgi:hypothetical protein